MSSVLALPGLSDDKSGFRKHVGASGTEKIGKKEQLPNRSFFHNIFQSNFLLKLEL